MSTVIERAIAYLRTMDGGMQGSRGSDATYNAAQAMVRGFELDNETSLRLLIEVHNPMCKPQWTERELRHKVESAARDSRREPGYLLKDDEKRGALSGSWSKPEPNLPPADYHALADALVNLCPFVDDRDVLAYLDRRLMIISGAHARLAALPPAKEQGGIISKLLETFDVETLAKAGLLKRTDDGKPDTSRFCWPGHRLVIPWQSPDGKIASLQRRRLDTGEPKYVFPKGYRPRYPFGAETLRVTDASAPLCFCEGAADVLALRTLSRRDRLGIIPLGLPGVSGWTSTWAKWAKGRLVLLGFDADTAGDDATTKIAGDLYRAGASKVTRWRPRDAKDWAERLRKDVAA